MANNVEIFQGSTPTFTVTVNGYDLTKAKQIELTVENRRIKKIILSDGLTITENTIQFSLTQEQTLKLQQGRAELQVRILTPGDKVLETDILPFGVKRILSGEVIQA